jgi:transcription-repair coupling factor (superfamily II helicase)
MNIISVQRRKKEPEYGPDTGQRNKINKVMQPDTSPEQPGDSGYDPRADVNHSGGIIDIFPPDAEYPIRLEFFGDSIDSIRAFDSNTQRSINNVPSIAIGPAAELLSPRRMSQPSLEDILQKQLRWPKTY